MFLDISENEIDISQFCSFIILVVTRIYGPMNIGNNILNILLMIYGHSVGIWRSIFEKKNYIFRHFVEYFFQLLLSFNNVDFPGQYSLLQAFLGCHRGRGGT